MTEIIPKVLLDALIKSEEKITALKKEIEYAELALEKKHDAYRTLVNHTWNLSNAISSLEELGYKKESA